MRVPAARAAVGGGLVSMLGVLASANHYGAGEAAATAGLCALVLAIVVLLARRVSAID